jgi:hypothetical protein
MAAVGARLQLELMVDMIRDGLATAKTDRMRAGKRTIQVVRLRITDAGRRVLAGPPK